ncbi:hypothetical protein [Novilysobacter selenitireducens]|uniref:Flagellar protein FliT n=1 Tax=Novilysobacter selenitireducens TaxID=2872639 RepID=A0ABS7T9X4_9GAMM|nr:hypothetical protein [Lysobacter selenitireducens]MBZ4040677.1 hypothetical protein [Lysobacter selenitireducens]
MIPALPTDAIRASLDAGDWDAAATLMRDHEVELRKAIATEGGDRSALLALLHAQQAFLAELTATRDETAAAMGRLGRDKRGVQAYLASG